MKNLRMMLKNSSFFSAAYWLLGSLLVNVLKLFVRPDDRLILFVSFSGRQFSDSPKAIYEQMMLDPRFSKYHLKWALKEPEKADLPDRNKVKIDTFSYFIIALKAHAWITNSAVERLLSFKGKNTYYVNTWHGIPMKKLAEDEKELKPIVKHWYKHSKIDLMVAESDYDRKIFSRIFSIDPKRILKVGLPRNDRLYHVKLDEIKTIKLKLSIPLDKKIILYAPTFREYLLDKDSNVEFSPINFNEWLEQLGDNYVILIRAHYFVNKMLGLDKVNPSFVKNMTDYPSIDDLMLISDILISDYSSLLFDFSLLSKPMFSYAYDYHEYVEKRGLYMDITEELPNVSFSEKDLIDQIKKIDLKQEQLKTKKFSEKYMSHLGNATERVTNAVYKALKE